MTVAEGAVDNTGREFAGDTDAPGVLTPAEGEQQEVAGTEQGAQFVGEGVQ